MTTIEYTPSYLKLEPSQLYYKNSKTNFWFQIKHFKNHIFITTIHNYANEDDVKELFNRANIITKALRDVGYSGYFHSIVDVSDLRGLSPEARKLIFHNFEQLKDYDGFAMIGANFYVRTIINLYKKSKKINVFFCKNLDEAYTVFQKQIENRILSQFDESKINIITKPDWTYSSDFSTYRVKISLINEDIIFVEPAGYVTGKDVDELNRFYDKVIREAGLNNKKYYRIQSYSHIDGASKESRVKFVKWLRENISSMHFTIFFGFSPVMKTIFNLGRILYQNSDKIIVANSLRDALNIVFRHKAGVLSVQEIEENKIIEDFEMPASNEEKENLIYMLLEENRALRKSILDNTKNLNDIIARLSWDYNEDVSVELPPDDPFSGLYDAISIIKQDVNDLLHDREQFIKDLQEKEYKYHTLFDSANDAIFILDKNIIVECNKKAFDMFKCSKEQVINYDIKDFINKSYHNKLNTGSELMFENNSELVMTKANGEDFYVEVSVSTLEISGKNLQQVIIRDISKRKSYEKELEEHRNRLEHLVKERTKDLEQAKQKAEESDKLKTYFLANMSHEIRTPLNVIIGFADLLLDEDLEKERRDEYINLINNSSNDLLRLINDIIDMAKIEANQLIVEKEEVNLLEFFVDIKSWLKQESIKYNKENLELIGDYENKSITVFTDPHRLKQVFINLLVNALKFTQKGSISYGYKIQGNDIVFFVKDTGIGMDKNVVDIIFERFRQAEEAMSREHKGTGLGLSIAKRLVEILGGKIWVESEVNKGSVFYFSIPFVTNELKKDKSSEELLSNKVPDWADKTILIVEDEDTNYRYLTEILLSTNATLLRAYNGLEAVKYINDNIKVDVILMDIQLPELSGYEATKRIKKINPDIIVIAQTAFAMANEKEKCLNSGCNDYIAKPLKKHNVLDLLGKYLNK